MRIGIYTQPLHSNYGGLLQAWALQTILRRMGHEVVTFDPYPYLHLTWQRRIIVYPIRLLRYLFRKSDVILYEEKYNREFDVRMQQVRSFINTHIKRRVFHTVKELNPRDYDVLIVGSDQVWRPRYNDSLGRQPENSFLDFAQDWNVKRIAYAASFGTDEWEFNDEQTRQCSILAKQFKAISVREQSGITLCKEKLGVDAVQVLDPTLLLTQDNYIKLIEESDNTRPPSGKLLCYILDETPETVHLISIISKTKKLEPFRANARPQNISIPLSDRVQPPVEQWLRDFMDAEFVVTDSFHACVFSILFHKPFVVIGNKQRGMSRFQSLLSMFGLTKNLLYSSTDYQPSLLYNIPSEAYKKLSYMQSVSYSFIEKNL